MGNDGYVNWLGCGDYIYQNMKVYTFLIFL